MIKTAEPFIQQTDDNVHIRPLANTDLCMDRELRNACEQNFCGQYGRNCMCPPAVGDIDRLIEKVRTAGDGLLIQTVHTLEDSFDYEGMTEAQEAHTRQFRKLKAFLEERLPDASLLALNAGSCTVCDDCAAREGEECRDPEQALASVESHGVDVMKTLGRVGLKYNNGPNTVSYVGVILKKN